MNKVTLHHFPVAWSIGLNIFIVEGLQRSLVDIEQRDGHKFAVGMKAMYQKSFWNATRFGNR